MQRCLVRRDVARRENQPLPGYTIGSGQTDQERNAVAISVRILLGGCEKSGLASMMTRGGVAPRIPLVMQQAARGTDLVVLENYDDQDYGYLRIVVTPAQLRIEYHPASDGPAVKAPDDVVTVDLASRRLA